MKIEDELRQIQEENDGLLRPADVVEFATNPKTALHKKFQWDDSKAAEEYRLWQAREIIRVHVTVIETKNDPISTRAFVSLPSDRKNPGGGYRGIGDVMGNHEWRTELLAMAARDMERFQEQYRMLNELADVFDAMAKAQKAIDKRAARKAQATGRPAAVA